MSEKPVNDPNSLKNAFDRILDLERQVFYLKAHLEAAGITIQTLKDEVKTPRSSWVLDTVHFVRSPDGLIPATLPPGYAYHEALFTDGQ